VLWNHNANVYMYVCIYIYI